MYTILVVDDTLFNRKLMLEVLETKIDNARYLQAEDGIEAIERRSVYQQTANQG